MNYTYKIALTVMLTVMMCVNGGANASQFTPPEHINVDGIEGGIFRNPLNQIGPIEKLKLELVLEKCKGHVYTSDGRGYSTRWKVEGDTLWLNEIQVFIFNGPSIPLPLEKVFSDGPGPVAATWVSGVYSIVLGDFYEQMMHRTEVLKIEFKNGKVISKSRERRIKSGVAPDINGDEANKAMP